MAKKLYEEESIQNIADAIRLKNGSSNTYTVGEMARAIGDIPSGSITVDSELSYESENPVQNKVITSALDSKADSSGLATVATSGSYNDLSNKPSLATVATSGSYSDLSNKPTIPSVDSSLSNSSTNPVQNKVIYTALGNKADSSSLASVATSGSYNDLSNKPSLATVATSGSYNDLSNKPTIPTIDSAITQDGTNAVQGGAIYTALGNKADKFTKTTVSGSSVTQALTENTFYVFGEVSALTVTLATPANQNIVNEYHFRFTSGSTATVLTLPNSVNMPSDFQVKASKTYEISIIDNYGVYSAW